MPSFPQTPAASQTCKNAPCSEVFSDWWTQTRGALRSLTEGVFQPGVPRSHPVHHPLPSTTQAHYKAAGKSLVLRRRKGGKSHASRKDVIPILQVKKGRLKKL